MRKKKKIRKAVVLLLMTLMCISVTGCGIVDDINKMLKEKKKEDTKEMINSELTGDEQDAIKDEEWKKWKSEHKVIAFFTPKFLEKSFSSGSAKKKIEAEATYRKSQRQQETTDKLVDSGSSGLILIGILCIVLAFILLFIFLMRRSKVERRAPVPTQASPPPAPVIVNTPQPTPTPQMSADYESVLRANCTRLGIDYQEVLNNYGGDVRAAVDATNRM